jgi:hypothetical protein
MEKIVGAVYETTDYDKFKILKENREITEKALGKIRRSVEKDGWRNYSITVNEKYEIIEGQHTYTYAKLNKLPLRYTIQEGLTEKDCQIMNSARTSWSQRDYIRYHAQQGSQDFIYIQDILNKYKNIPISAIFMVMYKDSPNQEIKDGSLKCDEKKYRESIIKLDYVARIIPYCNIIGGRKVVFLNSLMFVYGMKGVDKDRLFNVIKKNCHSITPAVNTEMALSELERVYNRQLGASARIYPVTEWKKNKGV